MSTVETMIWKEIAGLYLSPSHDRWHLDRVLNYALKLAVKYSGDINVITAAVLLHDLGRSDPGLRGVASANKSVEIAKEILTRSNVFVSEQVDQVLTAIAEHDQPEVRPSSIEGRILKDADFLAGFGAWGILRIAMWAGETEGGVDQIIDRLTNRMSRRLESLEFPESKKIAIKEMAFIRLFLAQLRQEPSLNDKQFTGKYIIIEGISGSGKDTQAERVKSYFESKGQQVLVVHEPTDLYKQSRELWQEMRNDPIIQTHLLIADRYKQFQIVTNPALEQGMVVISVRSYVSTVAYQGMKTHQMEMLDYMHQFVPVPDAVIILDLPAEEARRRIEARSAEQKRSLGSFEDIQNLTQLRNAYREIALQRKIESYALIDANRPIDEITESIVSFVNDVIK